MEAIGGPLGDSSGPRDEGSAPRKRQRKSRSRGLRTKSGCLTCRKRHKKCDEVAPVCGPCSISNRECLYTDEPRPGSVSLGGAPPRVPLERGTGAPQPGTHECQPRAPISEDIGHQFRSPVSAPQPSQSLCVADAGHFAFSPDTVASELLTADLASNRWLDLLATDAAQADSGFSLATSPSPEDSASNAGSGETHTAATQLAHNPPLIPVDAERHAWQACADITLSSREASLFRDFAESSALWLDLFDPLKHFSEYVPRLALRNLGLMKAILALSARYNSISQANTGPAPAADSSEAVQYYYETLHYVQNALQYNTYAHSEEILATALIISTYEMLDSSDSNWKRHLKGVFWIQRSQNVDGASGGLRQSVWWAWLRQDFWAAFREGRKCFSFWRPVKDYGDLSQDELADRAVYLLSQTVNYCADSAGPAASETMEKRARIGEILFSMLERWKSFLGPKFAPLPATAAHMDTVFEPIWIHPPRYGVALQIYCFAKILITLHRPAMSGFDAYLRTQRTLGEAVATICGIAMELKDKGSQILSAQCLFGAGLVVSEDRKRNEIISLIDACEARTGWPFETLRSELRMEWAKVS